LTRGTLEDMTMTTNGPQPAHDIQATWRHNARFLCGVLVDSVSELGSDLVTWSRHALPGHDRSHHGRHDSHAA
jgi:hypothetical protein